MSANQKVVLVTGLNGYIAGVLGKHLVETGYDLRGTVRSESTRDSLEEKFLSQLSKRVKIYVVPDFADPTAFDLAVKGVHGIFHVASPLGSSESWEDYSIPAVEGTKNLLHSAKSYAGDQLMSIVVTSSIATILRTGVVSNHVFTEFDESDLSTERVPHTENTALLYSISKVVTEKLVWKFLDEAKPSFALTTINPVVTIGPPAWEAREAEDVHPNLSLIQGIITGATTSVPSPIGSSCFVDVRDVAYLHKWAFENPMSSNGQRFIACGGYAPPQAIADILHERFPQCCEQIGLPGSGYIPIRDEKGLLLVNAGYPAGKARISGSKAESWAKSRWRTLAESLVDTVEKIGK